MITWWSEQGEVKAATTTAASASATRVHRFGEAQPQGRLPFDLPRSDAAVAASRILHYKSSSPESEETLGLAYFDGVSRGVAGSDWAACTAR